MPDLRVGTLTFLFTDIEGSTKLWERCPDAMSLALARHDALLRQIIEDHHGHVFKTVGDAFCAAFSRVSEALEAALEIQLALQIQVWSETGLLRIRIGLHTGEAEERDNDYFGRTLNRVARLQAIGHGQQTLLSQATYALVSTALPSDTRLQDMGMHRLKDLSAPEHIWQLLHPDLPTEFPPLRSLDYLPTNLPQQITSFVGREKEMVEVKGLLQSTRLLTLTGSGGAGKTRLMLQVAADLLEAHPDGVWLVELAPLADPALVMQVVATTLNIREEPGQPLLQTLTDHLRTKSLLLLMDNCEHLVAEVANLADMLLKSCPGVHILASSREGLGLSGEQTYRVPSLGLPPVSSHREMEPADLLSYDAARLFADRATLVKPDFRLTPTNAPILARLCHRLDGIPLALELAAVRVRAMPIEQIESRLNDRFRLLTGGSRTALPRHQTLQALIDWSFDLLSNQEKALLTRLSVFAGGWTLEACEQVGSGELIREWEVLDLLSALVDKSLVLYEEDENNTRYRLLETVRQYALERLMQAGEGDTYRRRHRDYFLTLAEQGHQTAGGHDSPHWLDRQEAEHANFRSALAFCQGDPEGALPGLELATALVNFWSVRGYLREGREWLTAALTRSQDLAPARAQARALNMLARLAISQGDYEAARDYHQQALTYGRAAEDVQGISAALRGLAAVAGNQGDYSQAFTLLEEAYALIRETADRTLKSTVLSRMAAIKQGMKEYDTSRSLYERALLLEQEMEDVNGQANVLDGMAALARLVGDKATWATLTSQALELWQRVGNKQGMATTLIRLGSIALDAKDYEAASAHYTHSLRLAREIGAKWLYPYPLTNLGSVAGGQNQFARQALLSTAAQKLFGEMGITLSAETYEEFAQQQETTLTALGERAYEEAVEKANRMPLEQLLDYALLYSEAE